MERKVKCMNSIEISVEMLEFMAGFYLILMFDNIPMIPVSFKELSGGDLGVFILEKADDYNADTDELLVKYEDRSRYKPLWGELGGVELCKELSYQDPLNHPKLQIEISTKCAKSMRKCVSVLLHELLHYYLWYIGWDWHDDDSTFDREARKRGLATNYGMKADTAKIDGYIQLLTDNLSQIKLSA